METSTPDTNPPITDKPDRKGEHDDLALRETDGWAYHATNHIDKPSDVRGIKLARPVGAAKRLEILKGLIRIPGIDFDPGSFFRNQRYLSPRYPYQATPLSYINASGRGWNLWGETNSLQYFHPGDRRQRGRLEFYFMDVRANSVGLVTLNVVCSSEPGTTGSFDVETSASADSRIDVSGYFDHVVDVVVRPGTQTNMLVRVVLGPNVDFFNFKSVTYLTIG
ncbi:hypothetical protein QBC44DRAFT_327701 [Cladorrhinum sp. PSN332]|nr:hypothetical protein QBC44DRAFT_327701 [Cladorrhinum sp. PSN332]